MPIHEFHCPTCDRLFEELIRSTDKEAEVACPVCGNTKVTRQLSVFAARSNAGCSGETIPEQCRGCCNGGACGLG